MQKRNKLSRPLYYLPYSKDILSAMQKADKEMYSDKERYYKKFPERRKR